MSRNHTARAFWIARPRHGEIREQALSQLQPNEARIRTLYSAISRGTETLVYRGGVPAQEYTSMRAPFQEGDFPGPVKYGYINVGVVEEGPQPWPGKQVFCLYPHQTRYNVPVTALHPLPDDVPAHRAVLAANLETAINALWDAQLEHGSRITVIGAGTLGCLCAWLATKHYNAEAELVDIDETRAATAEKLNIDFAIPQRARADAPVILHTSATESGLRTALSLAAFEALIVELSWYGDSEPRVPLGKAFHSRRLTIRSSQVGHVAKPRRHQHSRDSRLRMALSMLADPQLDVLIDSQGTFDELPVVLADLADGTRTAICHRIRYDEEEETHV